MLDDKQKIQAQLHLGTDFEYTRLVDKRGNKVDPFVAQYDITKIKDLSKEIKNSQKINTHSPRFVTTLERALTKIFQDVDLDKSGELTYEQFHTAFTKLENYQLNELDLRTLLALADENPNGKITWLSFIPDGIDAI